MEGNAITVKIGAETDGIQQSLKKVEASLGRLESSGKQASKGFDTSFSSIAKAGGIAGLAVGAGMAAISAATAAAQKVVAGFSDALDLGGRLNDLSSRTGETAGNLLILERAFQNTGVGADKVGPSINRLQKFIEEAGDASSEQGKTLDALGIKYQDLAGKTQIGRAHV